MGFLITPGGRIEPAEMRFGDCALAGLNRYQGLLEDLLSAVTDVVLRFEFGRWRIGLPPIGITQHGGRYSVEVALSQYAHSQRDRITLGRLVLRYLGADGELPYRPAEIRGTTSVGRR